MAEPYSKEKQLGPRRRKYRRVVASRKQFQQLAAEKIGPCRVCTAPSSNGHDFGVVDAHHVVPRSAPYFGDDLADNLAPVHRACHDRVHAREPEACRALVESLTDAEYAYAVTKGGEDFFERYYGIVYAR